MNHRLRLAAGSRTKALEAGLWQGRDARMYRLATMNPRHLVNALLAALAAGEGANVTRPLTEAVVARNLVGLAEAVALERSTGGKCA